MATWLHRMNTVQRGWWDGFGGPMASLLRQQSSQLDLGVEFNPRCVGLIHLGLERVVGNGRPRQAMWTIRVWPIHGRVGSEVAVKKP